MSAQLTIKDLKAKMQLKKTMENEVVLKSSGMENGVNGSRKRQSSTPMENPAKRITPVVFIGEESMFQRQKGATKVYAGRKKTTESSSGNSNFSEPSQIMRDCQGIAFDDIRPALLQCSSVQKLEFINKNLHFVKESEDIFRETTIAEFSGITKLPSRFPFWYKYYESLVVMKKNEEVSKLEELIAKAGENKKQVENGRKTVIIDAVHTRKRCRPTQVSVVRATPTAQESIAIQSSTAIRTTVPQSTNKMSSSANQTQKSSTTIKTTVPQTARKQPTKPAPMWLKVQKQMKKMRK